MKACHFGFCNVPAVFRGLGPALQQQQQQQQLRLALSTQSRLTLQFAVLIALVLKKFGSGCGVGKGQNAMDSFVYEFNHCPNQAPSLARKRHVRLHSVEVGSYWAFSVIGLVFGCVESPSDLRELGVWGYILKRDVKKQQVQKMWRIHVIVVS